MLPCRRLAASFAGCDQRSCRARLVCFSPIRRVSKIVPRRVCSVFERTNNIARFCGAITNPVGRDWCAFHQSAGWHFTLSAIIASCRARLVCFSPIRCISKIVFGGLTKRRSISPYQLCTRACHVFGKIRISSGGIGAITNPPNGEIVFGGLTK